MEITFVTTNKGKFKEAKHIFEKFGIKLKQLDVELPEIRADDVVPVVEKKVIAAFEAADGPAIADDSGVFIPKLNGFPGVYSGYFYRKLGAESILKLVKPGTPAIFRTAVGYYDGKEEKICVGEHKGKIVKPKGKNGWAFDPLFLPEGRKRTYAQDMKYKKENSHRARAFRKLAEWLSASL
jgi:XTP/dITP diphosphohydrolase